MADKAARKPYVRPIVQKRCRLTDIAEQNVLITGQSLPKGGCFSKNR